MQFAVFPVGMALKKAKKAVLFRLEKELIIISGLKQMQEVCGHLSFWAFRVNFYTRLSTTVVLL